MKPQRNPTSLSRHFFSHLVTALMLLSPALQAGEPVHSDAAPVRISLYPPTIVLSGARSMQGLRVTADLTNGGLKEVTTRSKFTSSNESVAIVTEAGVVFPKSNGEATITATLGGLEAKSTLKIVHIEDDGYNFQRDVLPVVEHLTCNQMGCHGSPKGKKRLQLSLFSADPHKDFLQLTDPGKKLIDRKSPKESWMLLKATCEEDHGGGVLTSDDSPDYKLLTDWISKGATEGSQSDPALTRIEVYPSERTLVPGEKFQLLIEAYYNDGSMRDVTRLAGLKSNEDSVAKVDAAGMVDGTGYGEAVVMVTYGGQLSTSRITLKQPESVAFPEFPPNNKIDELVLAKLRSLNIVPSELSSDEEFLRRVYLDVLGQLPTPAEARAFLADRASDKRRRVIDSLLERPEYADFFSVKWGDILQINRDAPAQLNEKGVWVFHRWLWDALDHNMPMDRFVKELLTAKGSGYRNGPANFFRVGEGPQGMAEHASTAFLGVRLDCAHCHNHPFEQFTLNDNLGMAAFFTRVRIKRTQEQDEEVVYLAESGSIKNPDTNENAPLKFLGGAEIAGHERTVLRIAEKARLDAESAVRDATEKWKAATAKLSAEKTANEKTLAELATQQKAAADTVSKARKSKDSAAEELADAETALTASTDQEKSTAELRVSEREAALKGMNERLAEAENTLRRCLAEKTSAEKKFSGVNLDLQTIVNAAQGKKVAAEKEFAEKTASAKSAAAAVQELESAGDPRAKLADWITSPTNPYFARHLSNRVWTWLLGRGIIDEPDDFRSTNPASNDELLNFLAQEFVRSGYDMKGMFRLILNSRVYQLSAEPNRYNKHDRIHYSHAKLKRLTAEQLATAITQATGVQDRYPGMPLGTRATQLPDVAMRSEFLDLFGRPKRATPVESERTCDTHLGQTLHLISSDALAVKLRDNNGRAAKLSASSQPWDSMVEELYLATLCRYPTDTERTVILAQPVATGQRREKAEDLLWVLLNTKEFLFNH